MKNLFMSFFISVASVSVLAADPAKMVSIDALEVRNEDGSVKTYIIHPGEVRFWDRENSLVILDGKTGGCTICDPTKTFIGTLEKPISIQFIADGVVRLLTIPANRTSVFADSTGYQIDVKDHELGAIALDEISSTAKKIRVWELYSQGREITDGLLTDLANDAADKRFKHLRQDYRMLMNYELYSEDLKRLAQIIQSVPKDERPLDIVLTAGDRRWQHQYLAEAFPNVAFSEMTMKEYIDFVEKWAETPAEKETKGDQTSLFWFFRSPEISDEVEERIYTRLAQTRFNRILELAKAGAKSKDVIWNDQYNLESALIHLKHGKTPSQREAFRKLRAQYDSLDTRSREFVDELFLIRAAFRD